jgi:hypothetical protein
MQARAELEGLPELLKRLQLVGTDMLNVPVMAATSSYSLTSSRVPSRPRVPRRVGLRMPCAGLRPSKPES